MRWIVVIAGFLTVVGVGCSGMLSKPQGAVASGGFFADLPASSATSDTLGGDPEKMRVGDEIVINFAQPSGFELPVVGTIREDGTVVLLSNKVFTAAGKTVREFEKEVSDSYGPKIYQISVTDPAPFIVMGEVKAPGKRPFLSAVTVLKAIESAGGFTERASQRNVKLLRADGQLLLVNCVKARTDAKLDLQVYPGDRVLVPGRLW